jgi:putative ABC transport system permease protein
MLKRTIQKDKRQIGTMKALGVSDGRIIGVYLAQFCFAALIGALIGCFTAMLVSDGIIGIFALMFEVPALSFAVYPGLWSAAVITAVLLCAVSGLIALSAILPLLPAAAMRPRIPKGGKRLVIERVSFLWKRLSFNTRYALKNTLRNKGRFFAVVLGMCGSCALLVFSLGFYDSLDNSQTKFFDNYVNYSVIVDFDPIPLNAEHSAAGYMEFSQKALFAPVDIKDENYMLTVVEDDFEMVNIPTEALKNGVIIPEYFARQWGVSVGDTIKINDIDVVVSAVITQYLGLTVYAGFDYLHSLTDEIPLLYNTLYGRSGDISTLAAYLKDSDIDFSTIDDDRKSIDSMMESMMVLIWFMIACSVVLGFTVLYSVGLINLSAREHEYMFMGVMGYPHKSILLAHIKETVLQLFLAIPFGFLLGNVLLESIKGEFSGNSFVIASAIYPLSYILSAVSVVAVTAFMAVITSRHIERLDIVEGLKAQDE